jgi:predicted O-linked N-acetylglucosamine transferase (SPINDLY family)
MSAAGLGCLAASSPEAFVEIAKGLASDIPRLVAFKSSLRNAMAASPLCDAASFTTRLERKLERLFRVGSS